MAAGAETVKNFASDSTGQNIAIETVSTNGTTSIALGSFLTEKKSSSTSAIVTFTAADTGSIESTSNIIALGNSMHCAAYMGASTSNASAEVALALFCNPTTAGLMGLTEAYTLTASALRQATAGDYLAPRYVFDCAGAAFVKPVVISITAGSTINITLRPL